MKDAKSRALERMMTDMDGMESQKMFGGGEAEKSAKGVDITISVIPNTGEPDGDEFPEGHDESMCKGGCAYHSGGIVAPESEDVDESGLPPFLRKKKKSL